METRRERTSSVHASYSLTWHRGERRTPHRRLGASGGAWGPMVTSPTAGDPRARASKTSTRGRRTSDTLNGHEHTGGFVHGGPRVLIKNVPHEAWDAREPLARALAAPVDGRGWVCLLRDLLWLLLMNYIVLQILNLS